MIVRLTATAEDHRIGQLAAAAIGLAVLEAGIPSPLPGVKPGLANIVVLIALARYGFRAAAWVSMLRVVAGSVILGTFLSPGFFLSFTGAGFSLIALWIASRLPERLFGPVTQSVAASFAHMAGQLLVAYLWLVPHPGIVYLVPVFGCAALLFGVVNGLVAASFLPLRETR